MLSRILAIVVTILSVAFLGFAGVVTFGGPNWGGIARSMTDYQFERSIESGQWTATSADGASVGSSQVLPGVVVAALDDKIAKLKERLDDLNTREPRLREREQAMERHIEADRAALTASIELQEQRLAQLQQQYAQLSGQVVQKAAEGTAVEQVVSDRRADVFRLSNQLEVLRADQARISQIDQQMSDLIEQINGDLERAERREQQLRSRLGQ